MIVFLDMDDVLCDHRDMLYRKAGITHWSQLTNLKVYTTNNFFYGLKKTGICDKLVEFIVGKFGGYQIITRPQDICKTSCMMQKLKWIKKNLAMQPQSIIFTSNKAQYARGNMLIDDFGKNIEAWRKSGGIGIKCKNNSKNYTIDDIIKYINERFAGNEVHK